MRMVKTTLLKIPVLPAPTFPAGKETMVRTCTACGGELLVATFYRRNAAAWRLHIDRAGNTATHNLLTGKWSKTPVSRLTDAQDHPLCWNVRTIGYAEKFDEIAGRKFFGYQTGDTYRALAQKQSERDAAKSQAARDERDVLVTRLLDEQPTFPDDAVRWALDAPLAEYRYLFFRNEHRRDPLTGIKERVCVGYCTHCHAESDLNAEPRHKERTSCPACGSLVTALAERYGHSKLVHRESMHIFLKTPGGAVFVRLFDLCLDFRAEFRGSRLSYADAGFYYFNTGEAYEFKPEWSYSGATRWRKLDGVYESNGYEQTYPIPDDFFNDTCLRHSHFADYLASPDGAFPMRYLAAYTKSPALEHLLDCGLHALLRDRVLQQGFTKSILDLAKTRPRDILGVSQPEVELFARRNWDSVKIFVYKVCTAAGFVPSDEDIDLLATFAERDRAFFRQAMKAERVRALLTFLRRQIKRKMSSYILFNDWRDYRKECAELGYNLDDSKTLYPPDLPKAHAKTTALLQQKRAAEAREKSEAERVLYRKQLAKRAYLNYTDHAAGLLIRVAQSRQELVDEGGALHHCVGGYAGSHLAGTTTILFIRRVSEPNKSYFTLEFKAGKIHQNRGDRNCVPPENVQAFVEQWLREIATKLKKTPKDRVLVAVA